MAVRLEIRGSRIRLAVEETPCSLEGMTAMARPLGTDPPEVRDSGGRVSRR